MTRGVFCCDLWQEIWNFLSFTYSKMSLPWKLPCLQILPSVQITQTEWYHKRLLHITHANLVAPLVCGKVCILAGCEPQCSQLTVTDHSQTGRLWTSGAHRTQKAPVSSSAWPKSQRYHIRMLGAQVRLPVLTLLYQLRQGCTTSGSSMPCSSMYQMLKLKLGPQDIRGTAGKSVVNVRSW